MSFHIRHSIPGRLRLRFTTAEHMYAASNSYQEVSGVTGLRGNIACRSLVIHYDAIQISQDSLVALLAAPQVRIADDVAAASACSCVAGSSSSGRFRRFLALTGVMGCVFLKEMLLKTPLTQTLFSPLGGDSSCRIIAAYQRVYPAYS